MEDEPMDDVVRLELTMHEVQQIYHDIATLRATFRLLTGIRNDEIRKTVLDKLDKGIAATTGKVK